ncbi:MAG: hypothetical protein HQL39_19215 [Alphaproteobacteria bacterium]|nr:hypothetical protein [Alphaproteobacteria bacterium]
MGFDISQPAITQAIYKTILAAYTESPASGLPAASADDQVFFAYSWPGATLKEADYQNPWSPDNQQGLQLATENVSTLVNPIPLLSQGYTQSGNLVEQVYQFILLAEPATTTARLMAKAAAPVVDVERRVTVNAPTPIADHPPSVIETLDLERAYADAAANLIAHRLRFDLSTATGAAAWEALRPDFEAVVRAAWSKLQDTKAKAVADRPKLRLTATNPVASVLSSANQAFSSTSLASVVQPGVSYHPSYVSPSDFADPERASGWPFVPSIAVTTPDPAQPNLKISFRFCRVDIRRPWLFMTLLQMQGWKIEGQSAGSLSTGEATNNRGSFPLLPEHFVVARDLMITGTGDALLYSAKGLQILAWINRVTPYMPPSA